MKPEVKDFILNNLKIFAQKSENNYRGFLFEIFNYLCTNSTFNEFGEKVYISICKQKGLPIDVNLGQDMRQKIEIKKIYNEIFSFEKYILQGIGVCQQFNLAFLDYVVFAKQITDIKNKFGILFGTSQGSFSSQPHTIAFIEIDGEKRIFDLTIPIEAQSKNVRDSFFCITFEEYKNNYYKHSGKKFIPYGQVTFKQNLLAEKVHDILSESRFSVGSNKYYDCKEIHNLKSFL